MSAVLPLRAVEKPWGRDTLPAPFVAPAGKRIGEVWFEPPAQLPQLLVKYIFTSERLSVQVHPSDDQLPGHGKEECWLILDAQPGAKLGIGFVGEIGADAMRAAAIDGRIEHLLAWHSVSAGDFFYIPAGTVHAIGAGIGLLEVQQNSDVTWRLYDYGRPREIHVEQAVGVALGTPYDRARWHRNVTPRGEIVLVDGPLFRLHRIEGAPSPGARADYGDRPLLVIPREGPVHVAGREVVAGGCALADSLAEVEFASSGLCLIAQPC